jgi:CRISPR-associated protein Csm3
MRFLLEWKYRLVGMREDEKKKGEPFGSDCFNIKSHAWTKSDREDAETLIKLFGDANAKVEDATKFGITRISVSDCHLSSGQDKLKLTEAKYENVIDRRSGTARHPRQSERVPAGIKFDFDIRVKIFEGDDKEALVGMVREGIKLIERDSLGGSGSRGYGRVKFEESSNATV